MVMANGFFHGSSGWMLGVKTLTNCDSLKLSFARSYALVVGRIFNKFDFIGIFLLFRLCLFLMFMRWRSGGVGLMLC
jgi:hypothetical protein